MWDAMVLSGYCGLRGPPCDGTAAVGRLATMEWQVSKSGQEAGGYVDIVFETNASAAWRVTCHHGLPYGTASTVVVSCAAADSGCETSTI